MGRMLEAMNRNARQRSLEDVAAPESVSPPSHEDAAAGSADESDEVPFIEVGGRDKAVDGSPSVLQAPLPRALDRRPVDGPLPRAPILTEAVHRRFIFRPVEPAAKTGRVAAEVIAYHDATHAVSEQYRALLARIQSTLPASEAPVVLLMALKRGAGTTTTLLNLAVTWCKQGHQRVVAVDAHAERPALARRLGVAPEAGLADVLGGRRALEQALVESPQTGLYLLGTAVAERTGQFLSEENVRWLLARLRERYEAVLVDGPTWDPARDSAPFLSVADAVYLVLDGSEADTPAVRQATRCLAQRGCRLGGLILGQ
jgi:Mrp family chromosome partitioning ATPase